MHGHSLEVLGKSDKSLILGRYYCPTSDTVALLVGRQTCNLQVAGSSSGWAPLRSGVEQATYTCVPLSPSSIIWYQPRGVISFARKITAGLVESNSSLPTGS